MWMAVFLALWWQSPKDASSFEPRQMSCRIEAQMRAFSLRQHLVDGGSTVRAVPTVCVFRRRG